MHVIDKQTLELFWVLQYIEIGFSSVFLLPKVDFDFQMDITKTKTKSMNWRPKLFKSISTQCVALLKWNKNKLYIYFQWANHKKPLNSVRADWRTDPQNYMYSPPLQWCLHWLHILVKMILELYLLSPRHNFSTSFVEVCVLYAKEGQKFAAILQRLHVRKGLLVETWAPSSWSLKTEPVQYIQLDWMRDLHNYEAQPPIGWRTYFTIVKQTIQSFLCKSKLLTKWHTLS